MHGGWIERLSSESIKKVLRDEAKPIKFCIKKISLVTFHRLTLASCIQREKQRNVFQIFMNAEQLIFSKRQVKYKCCK